MPSWPDVVPVQATRCLFWGYIWLNVWARMSVFVSIELLKMSRWPYIWLYVKLTWCSTSLGHQMPILGVCLTVNVKVTLHLTVYVKLTWCSTSLGHQMPILGGMSVNVKVTLHLTVHVKLTWCSTSLGHQMPLQGGTSDCKWQADLA